MIRIIVTLLVMFLSMLSECHPATWYVSPNGSNITGDGSIGNPWFSPAKARKSQSGVVPGDTVIFLNGTYSYDSTACLIGYSGDDSGTSGNIITYKAEDATHSVVINFNSGYGFRLNNDNGSDYIIIDGLVIVNHGYSGVFLDDSNQTVKNCWITATGTWPPSGDPNSNADGGGGVNTTETATDFLIESCIMDNVAYTDSSHGIYCGGGSGTIRNNIMRNNIGNGIQIQSGATGHEIGSVYVYRNYVHDNTNRNGIYTSSYGGGSIGSVYIYNNLVVNNGNNYASGFGITASNTSEFSGCYIYNNTLYSNHYGLNNSTVIGEIRNNISANNTVDISTGTITNGSLTRSNNLTSSGAEGNGIIGSFNTAHFASVDSSSSDFLKLTSSATEAIGTGYDMSSLFTDDYVGVIRGIASDIGAFEYTMEILTVIQLIDTSLNSVILQ